MNTPAPQPLSGIPPAPPHTPQVSSDFAAGVQRLIAFLLRWSGLLSPRPSPQTRELIEALQLLATLFAQFAAGTLAAPRATALAPAGSHPTPSARLPRCERRELLTPGIYAGLFFTRLAAIPARARRVAPTQPPISIFASLGISPDHAHFVAKS